jgi:hypothetical protein
MKFQQNCLEQEVKYYVLRSTESLTALIRRKNCLSQWRGPVIAPIYKKDDKTDCINYPSISLFSTTCRIFFSSSLLSKLTAHVGKIVGNH